MNPGFLEQISEYVSDIQIQEEHTLITLKKYRKALFYKDCNDSELSKLWLSMYENLEKDLDEIIRKTKPKRKEYQPDTCCWAHYFCLYSNENTFSDIISFGSSNPNS